MKKIALAALLLAASSIGGVCAGYDALNVGIAYYNQKSWDQAITYFTQAIEAGDLIPDQKRIAYYDRALARNEKGQFTDAISDYSEAIAIKPGDPRILADRAFAYVTVGQLEKAAADLEVSHQRWPEDTRTAYLVGLLDWQAGRYEAASVAFRGLEKTYTTAWFWLHLADFKAGNTAPPALDGSLDRQEWPNSMKAVFSGQIDPDQFLQDVQSAKLGPGHLCDASFYTGEWRLAHGDVDKARPLLQKAVEECLGGSDEKGLAIFEMRKLNEGPK